MNVQMSSSSYKNNNMFTDIHDRYKKKTFLYSDYTEYFGLNLISLFIRLQF